MNLKMINNKYFHCMVPSNYYQHLMCADLKACCCRNMTYNVMSLVVLFCNFFMLCLTFKVISKYDTKYLLTLHDEQRVSLLKFSSV